MSEPTVDRDPFEVVAESFLARFRAGERPSIEDLAARHPDPTGLASLPGSVGLWSILLLQGEGWTMSEHLVTHWKGIRRVEERDPPQRSSAMASSSQVESIFFAALEKKAGAERAAYLDQACGADAALRFQVERLLEAHPQAQDFLAQPAVDREEIDARHATENR